MCATLALILAQALLIGRVELTFDEAYYALWARWPQFGYLDHPPLVAWTIGASTALFGDSEFGVRALFWLEGATLPAMIAWIGWRLYDARTAATAALLWVAAPLAAGTPLATPDTPLTFFWALANVGLAEVFRAARPSPPCPRMHGPTGYRTALSPWIPDGAALAWGLVGLAAGAAALAKLTAGFLGLGIALALLVTPSLRREWRRPGPWIAAALALAVVSPFLIWNVEHGFATFLKQGGRLDVRSFAPRYLGEFLASQFALFNPVTVAAVAFASWRVLRRRASQPSQASVMLLSTIAPAIVYFLLHALHDRVQGNWPAPLYPALVVLAARAISAAALDGTASAAAAVGLAAVAAAYLHIATMWPALGPSDPAARIGGWRALTARVFDVARRQNAGYLLAHGYAATSLLTFYGPPWPEVAQAEEPERWTFRPPPFVADGAGLAFGPPEFGEELSRRFAKVDVIETLRRRVGETELESYSLFRIEGVRGSP